MSLNPGGAKMKKISTFGAEFSPKMFAHLRNRAGAPDCTYYIIYQYTAGTAHLTNHDTRHA